MTVLWIGLNLRCRHMCSAQNNFLARHSNTRHRNAIRHPRHKRFPSVGYPGHRIHMPVISAVDHRYIHCFLHIDLDHCILNSA